MKAKHLFMLFIGLLFCSIGCNNTEEPTTKEPSVKVEAEKTTTNSVKFSVTSTDAERVAYLVVEASDALTIETPSAEEVLANGEEVTKNKQVIVTVDGLMPETEYLIAVAAQSASLTAYDSVKMTTDAEKVEAKQITFVGHSAERVIAEEQTKGEFTLRFANEENTQQLEVVFVADAEANLPAGEYSSQSQEPTILLAKSSFVVDNKEIALDSAVATVEVDEAYLYTFTMEFASGIDTVVASYTGEVANMGAPEPENKEIRFTSATSSWGGRDHLVTFSNEDGSATLKADIYSYNSHFGYLDEGVYTVKNNGVSFNAGEIDFYYSKFTNNGEEAILDAGTIEVKINDDCTYVINIDVVDASGREVKTTYEGAIEGMSFENGYNWVVAARNTVSNQADGQFNITFKTEGTEYADYLTLDFYAEPGTQELPAGTYTISAERTAGNIDVESIVFTTFSNGSPIIDGGNVEVTKDADGKYSFVFSMNEKDSRRVWKCYYTGVVYYMIQTPEADATDLNFISANGYYSDDSSETYIYLVTDNGKQLKLGIIDLEWETSYVTLGHYQVSDNWAVGSIISGWYGVDYNDGIGFKSGSADIASDENGNYDIDINITLTTDEVLKGKFVGPIEGLPLPTDDGADTLTIESATVKVYNINSGNFGVQLYTPGSSIGSIGNNQSVQYINLDFYNLETGIDYVASGTYVAGNATAGKLDKAYTKIMCANYKQYKLSDGDVTFTRNDDGSYVVEFDLSFEDGKRYKGSYTGEFTPLN